MLSPCALLKMLVNTAWLLTKKTVFAKPSVFARYSTFQKQLNPLQTLTKSMIFKLQIEFRGFYVENLFETSHTTGSSGAVTDTGKPSPKRILLPVVAGQFLALDGRTASNLKMFSGHFFGRKNHKGKTPGAGRRVQCGAQPDQASNTLTRRPATHHQALIHAHGHTRLRNGCGQFGRMIAGNQFAAYAADDV